MAIQFIPGQVAISDPNPGGPSAISNIKGLLTKTVKLTSANFGTSAVNTLVMVLPADATITGISLWTKTQLAGGGITAATFNLGLTPGGTDFISGLTAFNAAGVRAVLTPVNGIYQNYTIPYGTDLRVYFGGTATTGAPTSGEMYLEIMYVR